MRNNLHLMRMRYELCIHVAPYLILNTPREVLPICPNWRISSYSGSMSIKQAYQVTGYKLHINSVQKFALTPI